MDLDVRKALGTVAQGNDYFRWRREREEGRGGRMEGGPLDPSLRGDVGTELRHEAAGAGGTPANEGTEEERAPRVCDGGRAQQARCFRGGQRSICTEHKDLGSRAVWCPQPSPPACSTGCGSREPTFSELITRNWLLLLKQGTNRERGHSAGIPLRGKYSGRTRNVMPAQQ